MELNATDRRLIAALADGLPMVSRPYAALAGQVGLSEAACLERLERLIAGGVIARFGVIVRHRPLGYRANAMVVWDVPDDRVRAVGRAMAREPSVTLCYRRPRRPPAWPYNLFCMIHGRDRSVVEAEVAALADRLGLAVVPRAILFSRACFKQRAARYADAPAFEAAS
ncbi:MAG: AsnC family transcriptional regulator [Alphaproteobacteria bacterium]